MDAADATNTQHAGEDLREGPMRAVDCSDVKSVEPHKMSTAHDQSNKNRRGGVQSRNLRQRNSETDSTERHMNVVKGDGRGGGGRGTGVGFRCGVRHERACVQEEKKRKNEWKGIGIVSETTKEKKY